MFFTPIMHVLLAYRLYPDRRKHSIISCGELYNRAYHERLEHYRQ
jgi:hypothetical protein